MATHPLKVALGCLLATGLSIVGIVRYTTENNAFRLWIPDNSDFVENYNWLEQNSSPDVRFNSMILANQVCWRVRKVDEKEVEKLIEQGDGILTPASLAELARVHQAVADLKTEASGLVWNDVCLQVEHHQVGLRFSKNTRWDCNAEKTAPKSPQSAAMFHNHGSTVIQNLGVNIYR